MFFVFDGVDGAGKSTQLNLFADWLRCQNHDVVTCKDPGTTELGESMRALLLGNHRTPIDMRSETLMFLTARAQLVAEVIRPALAKGQSIVCDRYVYSTVVYQGHAGAIDPEQVWHGNTLATGGLMADLTFVLDMCVEASRKRLGSTLDRMESRGIEYFENVRAGFLKEAEYCPQTVEVVDASRGVEEIHRTICKRAMTFLDAQKSTAKETQ